MNKEEILKDVDVLYMMWKNGSLGGEIMPEDENPHLDLDSLENYQFVLQFLFQLALLLQI